MEGILRQRLAMNELYGEGGGLVSAALASMLDGQPV